MGPVVYGSQSQHGGVFLLALYAVFSVLYKIYKTEHTILVTFKFGDF